MECHPKILETEINLCHGTLWGVEKYLKSFNTKKSWNVIGYNKFHEKNKQGKEGKIGRERKTEIH